MSDQPFAVHAPSSSQTASKPAAHTPGDPLSDGLTDPLMSGAAGDPAGGGSGRPVQFLRARGAVQLDGGGPDLSSDAVHAQASRGTRGPGGPLPHLDRIQSSFGGHDVSGVHAHTGSEAKAATGEMGANAFATGDHVAFSQSPSLHTAAHEAAHVVQQQQGVQLEGGVGAAGDRHERHADAVADLVVRGESAEPLLNQYAGGGTSTGAVQHELNAHGRAYHEHILDADTPTWGSEPEAQAIASHHGFKTRIFTKGDGDVLQLMTEVGTGDDRALSLLLDEDHYQVLTGGAALAGQVFNDGMVDHNPVGDGNCMYEAMFYILREGGDHTGELLQNPQRRASEVMNMRRLAVAGMDPTLANILGEELEGMDEEERAKPRKLGSQRSLQQIADAVIYLAGQHPASEWYLLEEKKKATFVARADAKRKSKSISAILTQDYGKGKKKDEVPDADEVIEYLRADRAYRRDGGKGKVEEEVEEPFVSLAADVEAGRYTIVTAASQKIRQPSGEAGFADAAGKTVAAAVEEAIAGLDMTGSISLPHSRHDFQPTSNNTNLQVQLGGSKLVWRKGKGDTSSTLVVIHDDVWRATPRMKAVVQAAHRQSFANRQRIEINPPASGSGGKKGGKSKSK